MHIHHAVPGLILLIAGAFVSVSTTASGWDYSAAVLIGVGVSLVLDEFALILHLQDVYWTQEGQVSVGVVSLAAAALGFALVGYSPFGISDVDSTELGVRLSGIGLVLVNVCWSTSACARASTRPRWWGCSCRWCPWSGRRGWRGPPRRGPGGGTTRPRTLVRRRGTSAWTGGSVRWGGVRGLHRRPAVAARPARAGRRPH